MPARPLLPLLAAALLLASLASCGGSGGAAGAPYGAGEALRLRQETPRFRILADRAPDAVVQAVLDRLEAHHGRITSELEVAAMPQVTVKIWQDPAAWFAEADRHFGVHYDTSGYVTGSTELRVLATGAVAPNATHEFAHAVSLRVNPAFANRPRWFWETVALVENGEIVDPRTLPYVAAGQLPTLEQLNVDPTAGRQIYELGGCFGEFIVATWGRPALVDLIRTNGDLPAVLGVDGAAFQARWLVFVQERYPAAHAVRTRPRR